MAFHVYFWHQGLKKIAPPPGMHQGKTMRHFASLFEREHGYGEAQVDIVIIVHS